MPFDQLIFGRKRNPRTVFSEEYKRSSKVGEQIKSLSDAVKMQLANAIYLSQLNGDESLHTGQFMVTVKTGTKDVTSITRIDFGALGRYGMARNEFDPLHTSKQYAQSGQFGKDYVSFLLQDTTVKNHLLHLWCETNTHDVVTTITHRFNHQVSNLENDPSIKTIALNEFQMSLSKKLPPESQTKKEVLDNLVESAEKRCDGMKNKALAYTDTTQVEKGKHAFLTINRTYKSKFNETMTAIRSGSHPIEPTISSEQSIKPNQ